jgi:predicted ester cyclase
LPDITFNLEELLIDGDRVVQIGTLTGTDTGGLMGMVPSGRPAVIPIVYFSKVANGEIVYGGVSTTSPGCSCRLGC